MQISKILVPTDFSQTANLALEQAFVLAARFNAEITVLHARLIHEDDPNQLPEKLAHLSLEEDQIEDEIFKYIKGCTEKAQHIKTKHEVVRGYSAHSAILSYLNDNPFDLLVIGTHGRSNIQQLLLGSVAEKVVRYANCPVLTIARGSEVQMEFNKIVVPFDFSETAIKSVKSAAEFLPDGGELELFYVFEKDVHPALYAWGMASSLDMLPEVRQRAEAKMDEILAKLNLQNCKIKKTICEGVPHKKISEFVNKSDSDLVVMATKGLVGLDRFLLGSTNEHVIRSVKKPILTLKENNLI